MGWSALKDGKVSSFHHRPVQERLETRQETRSESSRPFSSHWVVGKWWTIAWKQPWPQLAWWLWRLPWMPYFPRLATHLPKRYRNTNHNIISYWDPFRPFQQEKEITSPMFAPSKQWNLGLVFFWLWRSFEHHWHEAILKSRFFYWQLNAVSRKSCNLAVRNRLQQAQV